MLDIKFIRDHAEEVKEAAKNKRFDVDIDRLLELDERRRDLMSTSEQIRARRNEVAQLIPKASKEDRPALIDEGKQLKEDLARYEEELAGVQAEYEGLLLMVPNVTLPEVPIGESDDDNEVIRHVGEPRTFEFEPRDHQELGELLGIIDKDRAIKVAGARSYALRGAGALLEMAVMRLAMDIMVERGYEPIIGPLMVNESAMVGTGFFPYGKEDTYHLEKDDKFLVGTSEVILVSLNADEILERDTLPRRYCGHSPCFRREAGSAGRDTRGVYRVHQFTKVEQVIICEADAEKSRALHDELLGNSEALMQRLGLPYRVAVACTGEIGLGQVLKHEIETWMPSRGTYSETHSCSSLYDYQARRSGIRYRDEQGQMRYCYTLNNTLAASPRILIPILEHYQNEDGSVTVPDALRPYMHGIEVIKPKAQ
ncbi:serine--tRNA ligase [Lujinxingia litoralis]|uniref:Serine--tRNA ligase n=1 Tax=Lujinxingia litoralis TaxID=2211119 RepID=A0A328C940_9DELT|nr:serine--tRNA ligase [Lujinxingia litoralis]RAL23514.1 serine--tRNA ligase [Lujinxingia litoralis]